MMSPLVSWLMPVYNCEKTLPRAMDSMLHQTIQDFEIILVLEYGCQDSTPDICRQYQQEDSRVIVIENCGQRLGIAKSLNAGLARCRGKYIARMDADDYSEPERLEKQTAYMEAHPEVGLTATDLKIIRDGVYIGNQYHTIPDSETIRVRLLFQTCFLHPSIMFRADCMEWHYPEEAVAEDFDLFASLISKVKMAVVPELLVQYFENGGNTSFSNFKAVRDDSERISRNAIERELGISTKNFSSHHFGWNCYDDMPEDPAGFLEETLLLFRQMLEANHRLGRFDNDALQSILEWEWENIKRIVKPYNWMLELCFPFRPEGKEDIRGIFSCLTLLSDHGKDIVLYGAGKKCEELLQVLEEAHGARVAAICDSDSQKWGTDFCGYPVLSPDRLREGIPFDAVVISTKLYAEEIKTRLIQECQIDRNKIHVTIDTNPVVIAFHRRRLRRLKSYSEDKRDQKIWLICAADYGNLGDHAIAEAEHTFFRERFHTGLLELPCVEERSVYAHAKKQIQPSDLLVITGGGFLGSLWFDTECKVRKILKEFSGNPTIILPQTLYWGNSEQQKEQTRKIYAEHEGPLVLCARDAVTEQEMQRSYPECNIIAAPDMVLSQDWSEYFQEQKRHGALLCLKAEDDKESILSAEERTYLERLGQELCGESFFCSTSIDGYFDQTERRALLSDRLQAFAGSQLVITDRLHGLLFAVITGTPCVALNNCNHKVRATFEWVKTVKNVRFAGSPDQAARSAESVLQAGAVRFQRNQWTAAFEKLGKTLREFLP